MAPDILSIMKTMCRLGRGETRKGTMGEVNNSRVQCSTLRDNLRKGTLSRYRITLANGNVHKIGLLMEDV